MPKIRDLGINVIPETMRPPEIGPGGGGGCQGPSYGPGVPGCPAGTFTTTTWGMQPGCPTGTFTTGYGACGNTQNCPAGTFTTGPHMQPGCPTGTFTTGYWACGNTQNCPAGTFTTTGYAAQVNAAPGCPAGTFHQPSEITCYEPAGLTRESIAQLKQQLHQQIAQLDEYAKNIGPKSIPEIEAREKQLQAELEELATRRKELERNK
jgi:hypothetical protein